MYLHRTGSVFVSFGLNDLLEGFTAVPTVEDLDRKLFPVDRIGTESSLKHFPEAYWVYVECLIQQVRGNSGAWRLPAPSSVLSSQLSCIENAAGCSSESRAGGSSSSSRRGNKETDISGVPPWVVLVPIRPQKEPSRA